MARITGSKLVARRVKMHSTMTEMNNLGAALIAKPEQLESKMTQLFTAQMYSDNPLTSMLSGSKRERTISRMAWEWTLRGATTRPLIVLENVLPSAVSKPGIGNTLFEIKLDEKWWVAGDIIHPGTSNKRFQCRIQEAPYRHGAGWVYKVALMQDGFTSFLPSQFLQPGTRWAKLYSQYEEASEQSGSTMYAAPQSLTSRLGRYRKHYKVTGDAANEALAVKIADTKGKMHNAWIRYAEAEYWQQWYRELERGYWYSRSTNKVLGSNGRPIYSGAGVQELLEDSHVHYYSVLTAKLIQEYLMDIFYSRIKPGGGRKIKAFTGEYGMLLFHEAITREAQSSGFITVDSNFIKSDKTEYHSNGLSFGAQFTKYKMANGVELELVHNPLYDDQEINFEIDPVTGYPVESMRFTFLDFTGSGTNSNVQLIHRKGGFKHWYVAGGHSPYGAVSNNGLGSHSGDYYEIHVLKQCGVHIEDVSKCGELILKRQASYI